MASLAFLGLALMSAAAALPIIPEQQPEENSSSVVEIAKPASCRSGHTICVDLFNGCGAKTGGCYDACNLMTYTIASCTPTLPFPIASTTEAQAAEATAIVSGAAVSAGVLAEKLVIVNKPSRASASRSDIFKFAVISTISEATDDTPASTLSAFRSTPIAVSKTATSISRPHITASPRLSHWPPLLDEDEDKSSAVLPLVTAMPAIVAAAAQGLSCGGKTKCYDYVTSMNADCPRVRYGGCIDVCKDPKTQFKPTCRGKRAAGKWLFS